jgi:hypothetical protein
MSDTDTDHAAPFRAQAEQIDRNAGGSFAGAFVIVAPDGKVSSTLLLDATPNPAAFWSLVQTKAAIAIAEAEADHLQGGAGFGFGGGRR